MDVEGEAPEIRTSTGDWVIFEPSRVGGSHVGIGKKLERLLANQEIKGTAPYWGTSPIKKRPPP
jgi:hypothetical protein